MSGIAYLLMAQAVAAPATLAVELRPAVAFRGGGVTVADLVRPIEGRIADPAWRHMLVAKLPKGIAELSSESVARLVRRRLPGAAVRIPSGFLTVRFERLPANDGVGNASTVVRDCNAAARPLRAGQVLGANDVSSVRCLSGPMPRVVRYDRFNAVTMATDDFPAGTYLGALAPLPAGQIAKGTEMVLRATVGPVTIQRQVTTLQPGQNGKRVFVRDAEGGVTSAPLAIEGPEAAR
jgi:flagella basal body P-ring formation protein FlgA